MRPSARAGPEKTVSGRALVASFLNLSPACTDIRHAIGGDDVNLPVGRRHVTAMDEPGQIRSIELLAGLRIERPEWSIAGDVHDVADADRGDHVRRAEGVRRR